MIQGDLNQLNAWFIIVWFLNGISVSICLLTDTIDDLILFLGNKEEHSLDFNESIFQDSKIEF